MGGRLEGGCVPQQHISPGQGEDPGTLCSAPSQVELWSTELEHTLVIGHYEKVSFAFFPSCFGNTDGILCWLWPEKHVMVIIGPASGHIEEVGRGDMRRGQCGTAL